MVQKPIKPAPVHVLGVVVASAMILVAPANQAMAQKVRVPVPQTTFFGKWLQPSEAQTIHEAIEPEKWLTAFRPADAQVLVTLGAQVGFEAMTAAKKEAGTAVKIPDQGAEVLFRWEKSPPGGNLYIRPVITFRATRLLP